MIAHMTVISLTCPLSVCGVEESRKNAFVNGETT